MRLLKPIYYFIALAFLLLPLIGCGLLNPYKKNSEGFYEKHYYCCGPIALDQAFDAFYAKEGIVFVRDPHSREEISKVIQSRGMSLKEALTFFSKEAICITWPSEIRYVANKYGFELISKSSIDELDPKEDVAIVLVHGKFFSQQFHWIVFPTDDVKDVYGNDTVIDKVYLLKMKK